MSYDMFWNDGKCNFFIHGRRFTILTDDVVDVSVSFEGVGNDHMIMTTYLPLSFVSGGVMHAAAEGDKVTLPLNKDVVLVSISNPYRMHTMRIEKRPTPSSAPEKRPTPSSAPAVSAVLNLRWHQDPVRAKARAEARAAKAAAAAEACETKVTHKPKRRNFEFHML